MSDREKNVRLDVRYCRFAKHENVDEPILILLSDGAGMISGVCLPINGGYTAR